ncbi:MAG TPA: hypothetical protein VK674_00520 [Candidatus Limnocylindria bacterium]|nr:hypothetical protein [Candidatus Limnocylindria bacterium]
MSEDQFTKLFKYMQVEFKKVNDQLEQTATKKELDTLTNAVDAYAKKADVVYAGDDDAGAQGRST